MTLAAAYARLTTGYYNSNPYSALTNPGGFAADGHVINFPAALADVGLVAEAINVVDVMSGGAVARVGNQTMAGALGITGIRSGINFNATGASYATVSGIDEAGPAIFINRAVANEATANERGIMDRTSFARAGKSYAGMDVRPVLLGPHNYDQLTLFAARGEINTSGVVNGVTSFTAMPVIVAGTIGSLFGMRIGDIAGGGGAASAHYGLYVNALTISPVNFALYTAGTTKSYFGGDVGFGLEAPTAAIEISRPSGSDVFVTIGQVAVNRWSVGMVASSPNCTIRDLDGAKMVLASGAVTTGASAAATAVAISGKNVSTGRSLNAPGTLNASGADYAEYEVKAALCGEVAKGQIIGFDEAGMVTDRWASARSFAVKSTDPSYVGGDTWSNEAALGASAPVAPCCPAAPPEQPPEPEWVVVGSEPDDDVEHALWLTRCAGRAQQDAAFASATVAFEAAMFARGIQVALYTVAYDQYVQALADFEAVVEQARQGVDRIAYAGKVPVNVLGAAVGDYIIAEAEGLGIRGVAVSAPTFDEYRRSVGRVRAILPDGRAQIAVIIH